MPRCSTTASPVTSPEKNKQNRFWSDYEIDAHLFDDFLDDWLRKRIV